MQPFCDYVRHWTNGLRADCYNPHCTHLPSLVVPYLSLFSRSPVISNLLVTHLQPHPDCTEEEMYAFTQEPHTGHTGTSHWTHRHLTLDTHAPHTEHTCTSYRTHRHLILDIQTLTKEITFPLISNFHSINCVAVTPVVGFLAPNIEVSPQIPTVRDVFRCVHGHTKCV